MADDICCSTGIAGPEEVAGLPMRAGDPIRPLRSLNIAVARRWRSRGAAADGSPFSEVAR